ncbi:MAG: 2-methylisocitrate lyase [Actinomycetia bacterium]|nr:2-methylisocitrate lyase [Actinomycetes bacterium]
MTAGARLRAAVEAERPLQIVGAVNAYAAMLARRAGFRALYLSGAGVANHSLGLPDLGMTNLGDVMVDAARITRAVDLPLLVDIDTGWGHAFTIDRAVRELESVGVAGVQIEDQAGAKRCGHRPNKAVVEMSEMVERVRAATAGRKDDSFVVVARTDARAVEGLDQAVARAVAYADAGADVIFAEAPGNAEELRAFTSALDVPVLANITEFGVTPLLSLEELRDAGVAIALYPLSAARAAARAADTVYSAIRTDGTQSGVVDGMQTRDELYEVLDYLRFERALDAVREEDV